MALATKCPHCNTVFRVAADQLKLRGGIVRCGSCKEVFDGNAFLLDPLAPAKLPVSSAGRVPVRPTPLPVLTPAVNPATPAVTPPSAPAPSLSKPAAAAANPAAPVLRESGAWPTAQPGVLQERSRDTASVLEAPARPVIPTPVAARKVVEAPEPVVVFEPFQAADAAETPATQDAQETPPKLEEPDEDALEADADDTVEQEAVFQAPLPPLKLDFDLDLDLDLERTAAITPKAAKPPKAPAKLADAPVKLTDAPAKPVNVPQPAQEPDAPPPFALPAVRTTEQVRKPLRSRGGRSSRLMAELEPERSPDMDGPRSLLQKASASPEAPPAPAPARAIFPKPLTVAREPALLRDGDGAPSLLPGRPDPGLEEHIDLDAAELPAAVEAERIDSTESAAPLPELVEAPDEPAFVRQGRRRERTSKKLRIWLSAGSAVLLLALVAQGLTTFRNELAAQVPQLKPLLVAACAQLGCEVELPADIEMISVEQGELQALGETTFSYSTLLRNQSRSAQVWPSIELVLNDNNDKPVLRRVFAPKEYLPPQTDLSKGFPAQSEQAVKLYFELAQLKASGYHIAIFYP
jgi:predicted Zn finger-like uncharacterized protein